MLNDSTFCESCWCVLRLESNEQLLIGGIYRSPNSSINNSRQLVELINKAMELKCDYTVLVGDFNFPDILWKDWTTPHNHAHPEFLFIECLRDNFLSQFITEPTRYREGQRANILDLFITDKSEIVRKVTYSTNLGFSDHISFIVELNCSIVNKESKTLKRNFHKGNYDIIREELSSVDWNNMDELNVEDSWNFFLDKINNCIYRYIPMKRTNHGRKKQKWADSLCLSSIKAKHKAWNRYIHTQDRTDYIKYCKARNKCTKVTRIAKKKFEKSVIQNVKVDPKGFWGYVREKTKSKIMVSDLKDSKGEMVSGDLEKADLLNTFFASVFVNKPPGQLPLFDIRYHGRPVTSLKTEIQVLTKQLKNLNVSKAMGPDGCHPRILRETADIVNTPLQMIFNKTFTEGCVPTIWKDANISALYKNKGDKSETTNYRPVSLTCLPSRLCEKTVRDAIMTHMNGKNMFSNCQYGFRNKRSCILQLLDVLDDWSRFYDENKQIDCVYMDIKKAFDTIPHNRLLLKLEKYGIQGNILKWIRDFLHGRRQRVMLNGEFSSWKPVTSGVPQGSVLGPVLFIIYVNDLPDSLESFCKIFADDTKVYTAVDKRSDQEKLQQDLLKLSDWSRLWLLEFSVPKCKVINYGHVRYKFDYQLEDKDGNLQTLPVDTKEKDLGIWFQNNLKFDEHINYVVNRSNRLVGLIKRTFKSIDKNSFLTVYKSLIRSVLDYGGGVYYPYTKKNIQFIENVQRRSTRIVPELKGLSYSERLQSLKLPTTYYRRKRYDLIQLYKIVHGYEDIKPEKFFEFNDNCTRGHIFRIIKPRSQKNLRLNSFPVRCINKWNMLSEEIVCSDTVMKFKMRLDKELEPDRYNLADIY